MSKKVKEKEKMVKKEEIVPKILIGVPILAWTHEFATSFLNFWTDLMTCKYEGIRFHVGYEFMYRRPVHMAEEDLAQKAIDTGCTHLLLMDDDIYDVGSKDLVALLKADKDVIGGIMHASGFPYAMCAFRRYDVNSTVAEQPLLKGPARLYEIPPDQRTGIQKVDLIPFAFTLIKTEALKKLKRPWFTCNNQAPTDSWFADSILNAKLEYYAHFDVWLNHRGVHRDNQPLWVQMGQIEAQRKSGSQMIQLTPEEMKRHELMMRIKLEEAEKLGKAKGIEKMKFFDKNDKGQIASPIGKR